MGMRIPCSILVHNLIVIEIQYPTSKTDHCIEFRFQRQVNHGPESLTGSLTAILISTLHFSEYFTFVFLLQVQNELTLFVAMSLN